MKNIIPILLFFLLTFTQSTAFSQGIRGKIASNEGEALAFASVYIRNLEDGVPTNENGLFEFRLQPGVYDVVFQFLGYQSQVKTVEVQSQWVDLDIVLEPQIFTLSTVDVKAGAEDPALTVMRKAIAEGIAGAHDAQVPADPDHRPHPQPIQRRRADPAHRQRRLA